MGGFDFSGQYMTQRMLASSFADDDGEIWQSVFGTDTPANVSEMSQSQLIKHMATRSYANSDWLAKLGKLSTKGLVMEYLQQQAEINYMLAILKDLKLQSIQQEALLARVTTTGKDKNLDGLADSIHLNYNPNFMDIELGSAGDEWIGENVYVGDGDAGGNPSTIDINNLPNNMNELASQLFLAISGHESQGSYNAWNTGSKNSDCKPVRLHLGKEPHPYAPITQMTPAQAMTRYYGKVPVTVEQARQKGSTPCNIRLHAVGKYQWIPRTLWGMMQYAENKKYLHAKMTPEVQEAIALTFFTQKRPEVAKFMSGKATIMQAKIGIAQEWASIAVPAGQKTDKGTLSKGCYPNPKPNRKPEMVCDTYYNRNGSGNTAFYESTMKVWAILEKMEQVRNNNGN